MKQVFIGIDPGKNGAIGVLVPGQTPQTQRVPVFQLKQTTGGKKSTKTLYDLRGMLNCLYAIRRQHEPAEFHVMLELQQGRPADGKPQTFQLGYGQGLWEMAVAAMRIFAIEIITPTQWKGKYSLAGKDKEASRYMVQQLYPRLSFPLVKDHDLAEAILLADYCWRYWTQQPFPRATTRMDTKRRAKPNTSRDKNRPAGSQAGKTKRDPKNLPKGAGNIPRSRLRGNKKRK